MYPSVVKVTPTSNYQIFVEFDNNETGVLDMTPYLDFGVFAKLREPGAFQSVRVSFDTIEWLDGIDLDPKFVYEKTKKEGHSSGVSN